jgi:hypothetical protein
MSIVPTWPIAVGALAVGVALGAGADRLWMAPQVAKAEKKYTDLDAAVREQARLREVQRSKDEREAREKEQRMAAAISRAEQEKTDEIARNRSAADALIARLRQQAAAARQPTSAGGVPAPSTAGQDGAGPGLPAGSGERVVRLAERANTIRAGLAACYKWADAVEGRSEESAPRRPAEEGQDK